MNIQEIRQKYPQYENVDDVTLAKGLHQKHYSDMDFNEFSQKIGLNAEQEKQGELFDDAWQVAKGVARGATIGLADKASKYGAKAIGNLQFINDPENREKFNQALDESYSKIRQQDAEWAEKNPVKSIGSEIAGAIISPANAIKLGSKATSLAGKVAQGAGRGAVYGGVYGAGQSDKENIQDILAEGLEKAKTGAIIGGALPIAGAGVRKAGKGLANVLGMTTGTGTKSIEQAYSAGKRGSETFKKNLRGNAEITEVLDDAKGALDSIKNQNTKVYKEQIGKVFDEKGKLSLSPVKEKFSELKKSLDYEGFSKADDATKKTVSKISDILQDFSNNPKAHNVQGFDALKQRVGDISVPFEEKGANRIKTSIYNVVKDSIKEQAPEYSKIMEGYSKGADLVREIEKSLSLGNKATADTAMRKLQSVLKSNVNTNFGGREKIASALDEKTGGKIFDALAGQSLKELTPQGLQRLGATGVGIRGVVSPETLLTLPAFSPRLVGEGAYQAGQISNILNKLPKDKLENILIQQSIKE